MINTKLQALIELTGCELAITFEDEKRAILVVAKTGATDSIRIRIDGLDYSIEIYPIDEYLDIQHYEYPDIDGAIKHFNAVHAYRELCVLPALKELNSRV